MIAFKKWPLAIFIIALMILFSCNPWKKVPCDFCAGEYSDEEFMVLKMDADETFELLSPKNLDYSGEGTWEYLVADNHGEVWFYFEDNRKMKAYIDEFGIHLMHLIVPEPNKKYFELDLVLVKR